MNVWGAILGAEEGLIPGKIICYLSLLATSGRLKDLICGITLLVFSNSQFSFFSLRGKKSRLNFFLASSVLKRVCVGNQLLVMSQRAPVAPIETFC